uniref:Uncharacterized protein n=1 Tax=Arion vulgaris TaxID=1028688 RepID=A0A0B7B8E8_9EUPU
MGTHFLIFLLMMMMLGTCHVWSFSIRTRHERSTDLADALAILQRQRRRASADFLDSDRLLNQRPYTLEDENDWVSDSNIGNERFQNNDLDNEWVPNGQFSDFEPRMEYDNSEDRSRPYAPISVEPSRQELENIFDPEDVDGNVSNPKLTSASFLEKKTKEEMVNVKGDGKVVQKKSIPQDVAEAIVASSDKDKESNDVLSLDTLTKEEFHALMKAVGKLQKQAVKFSQKTVETPEAKITRVETIQDNGEPNAITIVQPATEEELKSVFEGEESPVVKETEVIVEREPNSSGERIIQHQVISNVSPKKTKALKEKELDLINVIASELEDNIEAEAEKEANEALEIADLGDAGSRDLIGMERDWLINKYQRPTQKRTTKRAASFIPTPARDDDLDNVADDLNTRNLDVSDDAESDLIPSNFDRIAKILELQDEVDNLKIVARLEDLENDVLTDALNEATLAQKEGSVTDIEFESLQQAIRIEEALQKLKNTEDIIKYQDDVIKRGEPWRRKRDPDFESESEITSENHLPSYTLPRTSINAVRPGVNDIQRLVEESNQREDNYLDTDVASFFMSNADECPAVQEYSTNCELADLYSLPVDFEARSLCNLHEMCYACGSSLQVGQDQCDLVYRAAASALCRGKQNCVVESEIFLRTMKLKNRYIPHSQPLCRSTCAAQFLGML